MKKIMAEKSIKTGQSIAKWCRIPGFRKFFLTHIRKGLREIRRPILSSSFDEYLFLFGKFLFFLLGKGEVQYTVFEACLDVLLGDVLADIEASLH